VQPFALKHLNKIAKNAQFDQKSEEEGEEEALEVIEDSKINEYHSIFPKIKCKDLFRDFCIGTFDETSTDFF